MNTKNVLINSGMIKLFILSLGVKINEDFLESLNYAFIQDNKYYYNISNSKEIAFKYKIPSEILLPNDVECSIYINKYSPIELKKNKNKYIISFFGEDISYFEFNKKPKFLDKNVNGIDISKYASMYGRYTLGLFVNGFCDYIIKGYPCKFCSLGYGRATLGKNNIPSFIVDDFKNIIEQIYTLDNKRIKHIMYTSGTYGNIDNGIIEQAKLIQICNNYFSSNNYCHHLTTMPPKTRENLQILKDSGLNSIAYDIEVYDENLFRFYCPGKSCFYGYKNFINTAIETLKLFGKNNVKIGFVGGLEPINSMKKGMEFFGSQGFSLAVNVFHPDQGCELSNYNRPTIQYLKDMVCMQRNIYKKYGIVPVFPIGGRRSSLDTEIYRGFFDHL